LRCLIARQNDAMNRKARHFVVGDLIWLAVGLRAWQTNIRLLFLLTAQLAFALLLTLIFLIGGNDLRPGAPAEADSYGECCRRWQWKKVFERQILPNTTDNLCVIRKTDLYRCCVTPTILNHLFLLRGPLNTSLLAFIPGPTHP